ncbi:restriction endonuclease subunit S [Staphylococcus chromogenes]|nr:restriction endonuclease subunit S [Staphylococcus chromogenes]
MKLSNSPFDWINDVPAGWAIQKTKYLFTIVKRQVAHEGQQILSITQSGIKPKDLQTNEGQMARNYDGYQILRRGDFAMNSMDLLTGWVDQSSFDGLTSPDYRVFKAHNRATMNARFFLYVFQLLYSRRIYYKYGQGVSNMGRWRLPADAFLNFPLPVPPLIEQKHIVAYLDVKTTEIDGLVGKLQREVELLERYRRELIARTVTRGMDPDVPMKDSGIDWIGEVPLAWEIKRTKALFFQRKEKSTETDVHLTPSQIYGVLPQEEYMRMSGTKPVLNLSAPNNMKHVEIGDFIIHLRSFQGGIELSNYAGKVSNAYTVISARQSGDKNYYRWLLKSSPFIAKLSSLTDQLRDGQSINFKTFSHMVFPLPPLSEQRRIADFLNKKSSEIDSTIAGINRQIELLGKYRKQVINDAVTGKVRVGEVA